MIRICPERDGSCPHGMACPFSIDRYRCDIEKSREALKTPGKPMTDISESGIEAALDAALHARLPGGAEPWHHINGGGMKPSATACMVMRHAVEAAIQAYLLFHPPASREDGLREAAKVCEDEATLRFAQSKAASNGDPSWGTDTEAAEIAQGHKAVTAHNLAARILALIPTKPEAKK